MKHKQEGLYPVPDSVEFLVSCRYLSSPVTSSSSLHFLHLGLVMSLTCPKKKMKSLKIKMKNRIDSDINFQSVYTLDLEVNLAK